MSERERWIKWSPAYDKRNPDPSKSYGIHGVEMRWYIRGPEGAVQFVVFTNWQLPHVTKEQVGKYHERFLCQPMAADVGYHSPVPLYGGQTSMGKCDVLDGDCYYDGSGLHAMEVFYILVEKGDEAVWEHLDDYYDKTFGLTGRS